MNDLWKRLGGPSEETGREVNTVDEDGLSLLEKYVHREDGGKDTVSVTRQEEI